LSKPLNIPYVEFQLVENVLRADVKAAVDPDVSALARTNSDIIVYIERMSYNTFNEDFNFFFSAIALGYNLPGVSNLSLSREQIVGIYSGTFLL
jgi:hypothetical protein